MCWLVVYDARSGKCEQTKTKVKKVKKLDLVSYSDGQDGSDCRGKGRS